MGNFYMEATQINYRRDDKPKTVDQKLQELSETSAIDTDIAPVFKSTNTYQPGDMVYYCNKLYVFNVEHTGTWAAADATATDVTTEISSLKSGLTNYQTQNDLNLEVPDRKNVLPLTIEEIKKSSTAGTWSGNNYTVNDVTFAVITDENGVVTSVNAIGTASADAVLVVSRDIKLDSGNYTMNGCPSGGSSSTYEQYITTPYTEDVGDGVDFTISSQKPTFAVKIVNGYAIPSGGLTFYPMIRLASVTDATFAPYIPSVNSRIEAVESNLTGNWRQVTFADVFTFAQDVTASLGQNCVAWVRGDRVRIKLFVSGSITTTSTGYKTIGNVSNNYRPANNTIMPGFVNSRSDGTQMLASASYAINTNGNINLLYGDTATLGSVGSDWLGGNSILFECEGLEAGKWIRKS